MAANLQKERRVNAAEEIDSLKQCHKSEPGQTIAKIQSSAAWHSNIIIQTVSNIKGNKKSKLYMSAPAPTPNKQKNRLQVGPSPQHC